MSRILATTLLALVATAALGGPAEAQERHRSRDRDYRGDRTEHRATPPGSPYRDRARFERSDPRDRDRYRGNDRRRGDRDARRGDYRRHDRRPSHRPGRIRVPPRDPRWYGPRPHYRGPRVARPYRPYRSRPGYRPHHIRRDVHLVFHVPRRHGHGYYGHGPRHGHLLHGTSLGELLGATAFAYLVREVLGLRLYDPHVWTGRWHDARYRPYGPRGTAYWETGYRGAGYDGGVALQLFREGERVAELADFDLDGAVDLLLTR